MGNQGQLRPAPLVTADAEFFWEAAKSESLRVQQCNSCQALQHPPGPMCPQCQSVDMGSAELSGRGQVYSWSVPRYPALPMFDEGLIVALVDLEEGVRLLSNIHGIAQEDIQQGMDVELFFVDAEGGYKIPQFRPQVAGNGGRS